MYEFWEKLSIPCTLVCFPPHMKLLADRLRPQLRDISGFPPKKTAAEFRDRSHLRVDVGRKVMGTWRQEVILWICGRWMNFCQHHDLKGSHKVMPIGNWDFPSSRKTTPSEICWPLRKNCEVTTVKISNYSIWCLISLIHSSLSYCISTNTVVRLRIVMIIVEYQFSTR